MAAMVAGTPGAVHELAGSRRGAGIVMTPLCAWLVASRSAPGSAATDPPATGSSHEPSALHLPYLAPTLTHATLAAPSAPVRRASPAVLGLHPARRDPASRGRRIRAAAAACRPANRGDARVYRQSLYR